MDSQRHEQIATPHGWREPSLETALAEEDRALAESEWRCRALRESEQRYKQLFEIASDWFWETDVNGRITCVSPNIEAILGLPVSVYLGKRLADTEGISFDPAAGRANFEAVKARQPWRDFIFSYKLPSGIVVWISNSGAPRYNEDGTFLGYRGVCRNVTTQVEAERRLRHLEQQYRQLFEAVSDWYWEHDPQGRLTFVPPNFAAATGLRLAEVLGKRFNEIPGAKVDRERGANVVAAMKERRAYRDHVHTLALADGRVLHVASSGSPRFDEKGEFQGYCGVSKDITARVEAQRAVRESEQRFRQLFEIASDYYWEADTSRCVTFLSENYEKVIGIAPAQTLGKRLTDAPGVSFDPEMGKMVLAATKARQPYRDFVYSRTFPDGRTRWFKLSGIPFFGADGSFQGYRGVGADMTAHVEADQAARLAKSRLHDAVAHVTQPFVFYDAQHSATAFNQAFTDLHRDPGEFSPVAQGVSFRELAEWQVRVGFYAAGADQQTVTADSLIERYGSGREHTYHLRDGRWMLVVYRALPGGGYVGLWTDVTEIKRVEAERRLLERQLYHSQRLEALGTLAGGVAHEINNALVPIVALTKLVIPKLPEESRERRNLETVLVGAERSRDLVKQILAFSRKEGAPRRGEAVDLGALLHDALRMMRASLPATIRIEQTVAPISRVLGDASELHQVIVNLVTNAAQAIGDALGAILVRLAPAADGGHVRLSVADTGCGMSEETKARVFEPFFTTKDAGKGTGLGLSVVHGIVKEHGGSITVDSAPGRGTSFEILLPAETAKAGVTALLGAPARATN
jgi:PAS domain S-box-containing protein